MALFDLLAHYRIFLPEFVKFRITPGFAEFYKNLSHFDNRVIIYPEEAKLCSMVTLFTFHNSIVGNYNKSLPQGRVLLPVKKKGRQTRRLGRFETNAGKGDVA